MNATTDTQQAPKMAETPNAGGVPAQRRPDSPEIQRQKAEIGAMIEAVTLADPSLAGRLNAQIVWHYLQCPDGTFGWNAGEKGQGAAPMPLNAKLLCVATALKFNLNPGLGPVLWLGNRPYLRAETVVGMANRDPNWVYVKAPKMRPLTPEERDMYGVEDGDMAGVVEATVRFKGEVLEIEGLGVLSKDTANKPGRGNRKDRAMTLKTFAVRDMLNRNYPLDGVPVVGAQSEELEEVETTPAPALPTATHPALLERDNADLTMARSVLDAQVKRLTAAGVTSAQMREYLGGMAVEVIGGMGDAKRIAGFAETLMDYPLQAAETVSPPAPIAPAPAPAPAAAEPKPRARAAKHAAQPTQTRGPSVPPSAPSQPVGSPLPPPAAAKPAPRVEGLKVTTAAPAPEDMGDAYEPTDADRPLFHPESQGEAAPQPDEYGTPIPGMPGGRVRDGRRIFSDAAHGKDMVAQAEAAAPHVKPEAHLSKAQQFIVKLLANPETEGNMDVTMALVQLQEHDLQDGDQVHLAQGWRKALQGDFKVLDELVKHRRKIATAPKTL